MVQALDPHSAFFTPDEMRAIDEEADGRFGGVGLEVETREGALIVLAPIEGGPAHRAGLRAGDVLVAADGHALRGASLLDAARRLRGAPGTALVLTVRRAGEPAARELRLVREMIEVEAVAARLAGPDVGVVRVRQFRAGAAGEVARAIEALERGAEPRLRALVLDLRDNPGGLLDEAAAVADLFLAEGPIVRTVGRGGRELQEVRARRGGTRADVALAVLVNRGSASAAEIVAGALRDHGRAAIVGQRTFGKASVQKTIRLADGSGLRLTVAHYRTPRGRRIHGAGIEPDVPVPAPAPDAPPGAPDAALEAAIRTAGATSRVLDSEPPDR
jgi:carboxyl-terminal processing protease